MNEKISPLGKYKGLLTFTIAGLNFCADMADIVEIINPLELNQDDNINSDEPHVNLGILKIDLIDLYKIFGLEKKIQSENQRIIVMEINNKFYGFIVDKVFNIYNLYNELKSEFEFTACEQIIHLSGILKYKGEDLFLLNSFGMISELLKH